jgi:hypothetical protein
MPTLTYHQASLLGGLFKAAPDSTISRLDIALANEAEEGGPMAEVHGLVAREAAERRVRRAVFGPIAALCGVGGSTGVRFSRRVIGQLWDALRATQPDLVSAAQGSWSRGEDDQVTPADIYNRLCALAAEGLQGDSPAYASARATLEQAGPDVPQDFNRFLELVPLGRQATSRLPDWVGRLNDEKSAAARLAYKDAVALADDAGPRLFDMLLANLPHPWMILRVLSAVMDRPKDTFVAVSELARFGEFVLDDIDQRLVQFRKFEPEHGREAGIDASELLHVVAQEIAEFETSIDLKKDGPWGARVVKQRQMMAQLAETRFGQIEKAMDQALPLQMVRFGKGLRGQPKLVADPDPHMVQRAEGLLGFFDHTRAYASQFGFGASRTKVAEMLAAKLDQYVEDLLELLRADEFSNMERVRAYLDIAADFTGASAGEQAAQIVRRRAAA